MKYWKQIADGTIDKFILHMGDKKPACRAKFLTAVSDPPTMRMRLTLVAEPKLHYEKTFHLVGEENIIGTCRKCLRAS